MPTHTCIPESTESRFDELSAHAADLKLWPTYYRVYGGAAYNIAVWYSGSGAKPSFSGLLQQET